MMIHHSLRPLKYEKHILSIMNSHRAALLGQHFSALHNCLSLHQRHFGALLIHWLISAEF